jgi:2'-5' RNA ligase
MGALRLMFSKRGDSALVILIPQVEGIVGRWRERHDPSAAEGMPAHITVLYPFLPESEIDPGARAALSDFSRGHRGFRIVFRNLGRFPKVLWVDPASPECTSLLTDARQRWPQCLPYGKADTPVVPHLTVADGASADVEAAAEHFVQSRLPLTVGVDAFSLMIFDGSSWSERDRFTLERGIHAADGAFSE